MPAWTRCIRQPATRTSSPSCWSKASSRTRCARCSCRPCRTPTCGSTSPIASSASSRGCASTPARSARASIRWSSGSANARGTSPSRSTCRSSWAKGTAISGSTEANGAAGVAFLLDVDNTLLDNDRVTSDLRRFLEREVGPDRAEHYFAIFEDLRNELGYADYLGALQRYRGEYPRDPNVLYLSHYLIDYPFANRLFPESLDVIDLLKGWGPVVILSDGDVVFQPRKIERSGLWSAVDGNVLIYVHKEHELDDVEARFPAQRYVLVDDKLRILHAIKNVWHERVTTVFPRQGHYAHDPRALAEYPPADVTVERIGDLLRLAPETLSGRRAARPRT